MTMFVGPFRIFFSNVGNKRFSQLSVLNAGFCKYRVKDSDIKSKNDLKHHD